MVRDDMRNLLSHHGVKGMKWGVRNDKGHEGESAKTKKIAKLDKKFESNASTFKTVVALHNRAAELSNAGLDAINNKPEYKNADFHRDSPLRQKYYKEHQDAFIDNLQKAADEMGTNASGTKKYRITELPDGSWNVHAADVQHADDPLFTVKVEYDENGHIVGIKLHDDLMQSDEELMVLMHHGVKGQKWGVRKKRNEAARAAQFNVKSLSDDELRKKINRLQMEKQFSDLTKSQNKSVVSSGADFASGILKDVGKQQAKKLVVEGIATASTAALIAYKMSK